MTSVENKTAPLIDDGTVSLIAEKTKNIIFNKPFTKVPAIDLTLDNQSLSIPYKINTTKNGFTIKFQLNYTGDVQWKATIKKV